jgi:hypothetical protein
MHDARTSHQWFAPSRREPQLVDVADGHRLSSRMRNPVSLMFSSVIGKSTTSRSPWICFRTSSLGARRLSPRTDAPLVNGTAIARIIGGSDSAPCRRTADVGAPRPKIHQLAPRVQAQHPTSGHNAHVRISSFQRSADGQSQHRVVTGRLALVRSLHKGGPPNPAARESDAAPPGRRRGSRRTQPGSMIREGARPDAGVRLRRGRQVAHTHAATDGAVGTAARKRHR